MLGVLVFAISVALVIGAAFGGAILAWLAWIFVKAYLRGLLNP